MGSSLEALGLNSRGVKENLIVEEIREAETLWVYNTCRSNHN